MAKKFPSKRTQVRVPTSKVRVPTTKVRVPTTTNKFLRLARKK